MVGATRPSCIICWQTCTEVAVSYCKCDWLGARGGSNLVTAALHTKKRCLATWDTVLYDEHHPMSPFHSWALVSPMSLRV